MPTVSIISLGCAKNLINSEQMLAILAADGFEIQQEPEGADVAVINTCGFIDAAKREAIDAILDCASLKSAGLLKKIIVAGCLSERYSDEISRDLPEVDAILGVGEFSEVANIAGVLLSSESAKIISSQHKPESFDDNLPRLVTTPKAWAYLKIAEGCDNRCAFCVIPQIRGHYRSRQPDAIISEARFLVSEGVKELILIAQDTTRYGADLGGSISLQSLINELSCIEGLRWIRLHYLYPDEITHELLLEFESNKKLLPYFDIPIQHVDDGILRSMRRRGSYDMLTSLICDIRRRLPNAVIRTSLIAGLPGEGEAEFERLCDFLRTYKIERAGVFVYSPEEGTDAERMDRPDESVAEKRKEILEAIQQDIILSYNRSRIGTTLSVLIEEPYEDMFLARSFAESPDVDGYIFVRGEGLRIGEFYDIIIQAGDQNGCLGIYTQPSIQ